MWETPRLLHGVRSVLRDPSCKAVSAPSVFRREVLRGSTSQRTFHHSVCQGFLFSSTRACHTRGRHAKSVADAILPEVDVLRVPLHIEENALGFEVEVDGSGGSKHSIAKRISGASDLQRSSQKLVRLRWKS